MGPAQCLRPRLPVFWSVLAWGLSDFYPRFLHLLVIKFFPAILPCAIATNSVASAIDEPVRKPPSSITSGHATRCKPKAIRFNNDEYRVFTRRNPLPDQRTARSASIQLPYFTRRIRPVSRFGFIRTIHFLSSFASYKLNTSCLHTYASLLFEPMNKYKLNGFYPIKRCPCQLKASVWITRLTLKKARFPVDGTQPVPVWVLVIVWQSSWGQSS